MKIKMWGTRGSLPRPMNNQSLNDLVSGAIHSAEKAGVTTLSDFKAFLRSQQSSESPLCYGGHTSCYEITHDDVSVFVDMGTGITDAAQQCLAEKRTEHIIYQTHMHWDHIMGMPFFIPIYVPGSRISIHHVHANAPQYIMNQFNGVNFPLKWDQLAAQIHFERIKVYEKRTFGGMTVEPFALDHPGGCFGYRFEADGKSLAIGVDGEYKRITPQALGKDLRFYQELDLLVFDAQYELDELASKFDWGHCSPIIGVDLALREGIRNLILTHHDPRSEEAKARSMLADALTHRDKQLPKFAEEWQRRSQPTGPHVNFAYDGLEIDLSK